MRPTIVTLCVCLASFYGTAASAQEKGQIGLIVAFPTNAGIIWHATDRLAVRTTVTFANSSNEFAASLEGGPPGQPPTFSTTSTGDSWSIGSSLSVLFYLKQWDDVRVYVAPTYSYRHGHSTTTTMQRVLGSDRTETTESTATDHSVAGAFGAQVLSASALQHLRRSRIGVLAGQQQQHPRVHYRTGI